MWTLDILLPLFAVGAAAGFMAGLLGVGGGTLIVPIVLWLLAKQQPDTAHSQHLAVGTSFAVMVFTTFSGALAQHRRGAIDWRILRRMSPAMVAGGILGSLAARYIPAWHLKLVFIVFLYVMSLQMMLRLKPKPNREMPGRAATGAVGTAIGVLSSWVGIGGGSLSVPFMLYCNVPVLRATATSTGLAWPMALSGAIGYLLSGWGLADLPAGSVGFLYLPAVAALAACTVLFAPLGVRAAHRLPADVLKAALGMLMFVIASQMLFKLVAA
ncbi:sulfite exporter TauE/SafE family protein [Kingella sp. SNUBH-2017]|jgi:putative membrane protein|uniref:Probable membrane transporter protein n=1 Tax=Kingella pumchi TaxID=2779506 RepID=A0ABS9NR24_9NEIS|nr:MULTISPECIES: sulfite exporter TauE/SafE family protein [Kingella]MCG6504955.1 sulfite exporter TauE/SafE family protein [Kingella pumchi]MDD2182897.1 sulfite exporter TauE/SafE family protein [Kingella sp. SNUBH-2017]